MSPSVHVQLEIILTGEEGENKTEETTYETWDEDMIDHDDQEDGNQVKSDHEDENAEEEEQEAAKDDNLLHTPTEDNLSSKVLRVHAGNISVGASYHSIRITENISTAELLSKAMEKFHIPQIDHHHRRTVSSVEYYLSVRNRDGEEITIGPEDKPYSIYETLNAHLTTPMPRLSEQLKLSGTLKKKKKMHDVQFLLHKRIKRTNDGGLVHIKLSLLAQKSIAEKGNPFQSWLMKKKKKVALEAERIDKMVAVHDAITISELTLIAFEKFHIVPHKSQKYRLLLHTKNRDVLLNNNLILSDVLRELSNNEEKQFVLHNFSSTQTAPHNNNKVCPETKQPIQVTMAVDRATQTILKRVDTALSEHSHQTPTEDVLQAISLYSKKSCQQ
ncbi:hypothetical protein RO3G_07481 [Rhizopus delemar RA 99-880]|uniref:Ras-associating domain-containing protein n=1 Tax=Rhizopus delemar (strain RA 99-880 / ATCC MYA-4621 / FGSC 9543 / NRRL 43880) TaxID=246409 RepID=I1C2U6_RHIO9|nr:hypothetical protein RO3G_07481 [Rhizopus delemar RA 99-880]|eukprot:EIE82776.1 hypothetical protein RO3G_07481 [Rhizopus delemar RA 99-880]